MARTKQHIKGSIVLALEGMSSRMMRMSRNEMNHQRDIPVEETLAKINAVTNENIRELANRILDEKLVSTTAIGPED
jgi:predicted Zn-dependent peptidase